RHNQALFLPCPILVFWEICYGCQYSRLPFLRSSAPAIGCVFLLDDIQSALSAQGAKKPVADGITWIVYDEAGRKEAFAQITKMRAEGKRVSGLIRDEKIGKAEYEDYAKQNGIKEIRFFGNI
ncbi:MAG: hypothetical protein IKM88_18135, partial [Lachnospiraceae bacterium]|nr:hypothetical protein [Lachnospiraceae bacterium]